jgi:hypothetical protein
LWVFWKCLDLWQFLRAGELGNFWLICLLSVFGRIFWEISSKLSVYFSMDFWGIFLIETFRNLFDSVKKILKWKQKLLALAKIWQNKLVKEVFSGDAMQGAICVQLVDDDEFTRRPAICYGLHRPMSQMISCLGF